MKNFYKEDYKLLRDIAKDTGTVLATYKFEKDSVVVEYNGLTIAFRPMTNGPDCRMLAVSVSYCAKKDKFKKKIGKYNALYKMEAGEFVQVPLAEFYREYGVEETKAVLSNSFVL